IALLDQDVRNLLAEVGLARHQAGKILAALRAMGEAEHPAACSLVECGALAVRLMLNNCIRTDGDAGVLRRDPISRKRVFDARGWRDGAGEYQRGTCYDCRIAQDSHRIAGAGPRSKFLAKLAPPLCRRTSAGPGSPKGFAAARIR